MSFGKPRTRLRTRAAQAIGIGLAVLFAGAGSALADPAEPTNYLSTVTRLDPLPEGVEIEVVGGDAFLQVTVDPGHEVAVPGYFGEPYLRIDADGLVWVNEDAPATYINEDRFGRIDIPPGVDGEGEPRWRQVGDDGTYAWHDHRTHWMAFDRPPNVTGDVRQVVFPWKIPIQVDGTEVSVEGQLEWLPAENRVAPILIGLVALVPLALWRRPGFVAGTLAVAGSAAIAVSFAQAAGTPAVARAFPPEVVFPALAVSAGVAGVVLRRKPEHAAWSQLIGSLFLIAWAGLVRETIWLPVLPSPLPEGVERVAVTAVLWAALGVLGVWAASFAWRARPSGAGLDSEGG